MISFTAIFQRFASIFDNYFVTGRMEELHRTPLNDRNNKLNSKFDGFQNIAAWSTFRLVGMVWTVVWIFIQTSHRKFTMMWLLVVLEQAFVFASSVAARFIIVRVPLLSEKWQTGKTLPRGMSNNFRKVRRGVTSWKKGEMNLRTTLY